MSDFPSANYDDWKLMSPDEEAERIYGPQEEDEEESEEEALRNYKSQCRVLSETLSRIILRADTLEDALLRCLREIPPQHIPADVYAQAQRALGEPA